MSHYFGKHAPELSVILQQTCPHLSCALLSVYLSELQHHVHDRDEVVSKVTRVRSRSFLFLLLLLEGTTSNVMYFKHVHGCPDGKS
jgi:hypothetical protein